MPNYKYNPNNTEGKYPTSFDFIDTEIKKDDEIVATDIPDLYDCDVTYPVADGSVLTYDETTQLWKPGEGGGGACNILKPGPEIIMYVDYTHTAVDGGKGTSSNPFVSFKVAFDFLLRNCKVIKESHTLILRCANENIPISETTNLNNLYGHRIVIELTHPNNNIITSNNIELVPKLYRIDVTISGWLDYTHYNSSISRANNNDLYIYGGYYLIYGRVYDSGLWKINTETRILSRVYWTVRNGYSGPIHGVAGHTMNYYNGKLYVYGGIWDTATLSPNFMYIYDIATNEFYEIPCPTEMKKRTSHSSLMYDNKLYIFGGYNSDTLSHLNDIWEFDLITEGWSEVIPTTPTIPEGRSGHAASIVGDFMYVFFGTDNTNDGVPTIYRFNLLTRVWELISYSYIGNNTFYYDSYFVSFVAGNYIILTGAVNVHLAYEVNTGLIRQLDHIIFSQYSISETGRDWEYWSFQGQSGIRRITISPKVLSTTGYNININDCHSCSIDTEIKKITREENYITETPIAHVDICNDDCFLVSPGGYGSAPYAASILIGDDIYTFGGQIFGVELRSLVKYNITNDTVTQLPDCEINKPGEWYDGSAYHKALLYNGVIHYLAGHRWWDGPEGIITYNISTQEWDRRELTTIGGTGILSWYGFTLTTVGNLYLYFGGSENGGDTKTWFYDAANYRLQFLNNAPYGLLYHTATYYNNYIYMFGIDSSGVSRLMRISTQHYNWETLTPTIQTGYIPNLRQHVSIAIGSNIYFYGGYINNDEEAFNDRIYVYNAINNTWNTITTIDNELLDNIYLGFTRGEGIAYNNLLYLIGRKSVYLQNLTEGLCVFNPSKKYFNITTRKVVDYIETGTIDDFFSFNITNNSLLNLSNGSS